MNIGGLRRVLMSVSIAIGLAWVSGDLSAQAVSGTILGTVTDQQGAVVGKATVSAKSTDTGVTRTATTDDAGSYRIVSVPAGTYEITVTAQGFKTEVRTGVGVTVGGESNVTFSLTVGAITEKVEVTGE